MAEKIKCGEYVRTNTGIIDKVIKEERALDKAIKILSEKEDEQ